MRESMLGGNAVCIIFKKTIDRWMAIPYNHPQIHLKKEIEPKSWTTPTVATLTEVTLTVNY